MDLDTPYYLNVLRSAAAKTNLWAATEVSERSL